MPTKSEVAAWAKLYTSQLHMGESGVARGLSFGKTTPIDDKALIQNMAEVLKRSSGGEKLDLLYSKLDQLAESFKGEGNTRGALDIRQFKQSIETLAPVANNLRSAFSGIDNASGQLEDVFRMMGSIGNRELQAFGTTVSGIVNRMKTPGGISGEQGLKEVREAAGLARAQELFRRGDMGEFQKYVRSQGLGPALQRAGFGESDEGRRYQQWITANRNRALGSVFRPLGNTAMGMVGSMLGGGGDPLALMAFQSLQKGFGAGMNVYSNLAGGGGGGILGGLLGGGIAGRVAAGARGAATATETAAAGGAADGLLGGALTFAGRFLPLAYLGLKTQAGQSDALWSQMQAQAQKNLTGQGPDSVSNNAKELGKNLKDAKDKTTGFTAAMVTATSAGALFGAIGNLLTGKNPLSGATAGAAGTAVGIGTYGMDLFGKAMSQGLSTARGMYGLSTNISASLYGSLAGGRGIGGFGGSLLNNPLTQFGFSPQEVGQGIAGLQRGTFLGSAGNYSGTTTLAGVIGRTVGTSLQDTISGITGLRRAGGSGTNYMDVVAGLGRSSSGEVNAFSKQMADAFVSAARTIQMTSGGTATTNTVLTMLGATRNALMDTNNATFKNLVQNNPEMVTQAVSGLSGFVRSGLSGNSFALGVGRRAGLSFYQMSQGIRTPEEMNRVLSQLNSESGISNYMVNGKLNAQGKDIAGILASRLGVSPGTLVQLFEAQARGDLSGANMQNILSTSSTTAAGGMTPGRDKTFEQLFQQNYQSQIALLNVTRDNTNAIKELNKVMSAQALFMLSGATGVQQNVMALLNKTGITGNANAFYDKMVKDIVNNYQNSNSGTSTQTSANTQAAAHSGGSTSTVDLPGGQKLSISTTVRVIDGSATTPPNTESNQ